MALPLRPARHWAVCAVALLGVFFASCASARSTATSSPSERQCDAVTDCTSLARAAVGRPVLAPTKNTLAFESGSAALGKRTTDGSGVAGMNFRDRTTGRRFAVNLFVGSDLSCPSNQVERKARSPHGLSVCIVSDPGDGVDIRFVRDGIDYVFSFTDPKGRPRSQPTSAVGRWALSIVDTYA